MSHLATPLMKPWTRNFIKVEVHVTDPLHACVKREDEYDGIIFFLCNIWNKQNLQDVHVVLNTAHCLGMLRLLIFAIEIFG